MRGGRQTLASSEDRAAEGRGSSPATGPAGPSSAYCVARWGSPPAAGGSGEVIQSEHLVAILKSIARGMNVQKLIDRDDMADEERARKITQGIRVLRRRELEEYLYDPEVLRTFLQTGGCEEAVVETVLREREELVGGQLGPHNIKDVSRKLFEAIRRVTKLPNLGRNREEFSSQFLVGRRSSRPRSCTRNSEKTCSVPVDLGRGGFVNTVPASRRQRPVGRSPHFT